MLKKHLCLAVSLGLLNACGLGGQSVQPSSGELSMEKQIVSEPNQESPLQARTSRQAAERLIALMVLSEMAKSSNPSAIMEWVKTHKLEQYFEAGEKAFFFKANPSEQERVFYSWQAEAAMMLAWSLNGLQERPFLTDMNDLNKVSFAADILENPQKFIENARLRPQKELEEAEAFLFHQHWRVRDHALGFNVGKQLQKKDEIAVELLHPDVVYWHRYAASWLIGHGEDWASVPTDT